MSTTIDQSSHRELRARGERVALRQIADRMAAAFPDLPEERIQSAIDDRYQTFEGSRIRDFVPVLVERSVRAALAAQSGA